MCWTDAVHPTCGTRTCGTKIERRHVTSGYDTTFAINWGLCWIVSTVLFDVLNQNKDNSISKCWIYHFISRVVLPASARSGQKEKHKKIRTPGADAVRAPFLLDLEFQKSRPKLILLWRNYELQKKIKNQKPRPQWLILGGTIFSGYQGGQFFRGTLYIFLVTPKKITSQKIRNIFYLSTV